MRKCSKWFQRSVLAGAACATIGFTTGAQATTFLLYDANAQVSAPDPTSVEGGTWQAVLGGTSAPITAAAGTGADGNYWQITDTVINGSKGYGINNTPTPPNPAFFTDPTGWTATIVLRAPVSSGPKQTPTATVGPYAAPTFFDIRGGGKIVTTGQVNAGADEYFFRAKSGASADTPLQDMDVHSYFNTYQMVYTPPQLDEEGGLVAPEILKEYVNGFLMTDPVATSINPTGTPQIRWQSGAQTSLQTVQYQKVVLESGNAAITAPTPGTWNGTDGSFSASTNWAGGAVPGGSNSTAQFGPTAGPTGVTIDALTNVGLVELDSPNAYTIVGPGTLNLVFSRRGAGAVDVKQGQHTISAPLTFERSAMFTILNSAASLSITGPINTVGKDLRKAGDGAMDMGRVLANSLKVSGGTLTIRANGTATGVCKVSSLDISFNTTALAVPVATMELNNNPIVIDYTGTSPTTTLRNSLKGAFNLGTWDGKGLTSSVVKANAADAGNLHKTALGYAEASVVGITSLGDQTFDTTSLIVRMTLSGDANLDGKVNSLDFNSIASNFGAATGKTWGAGDFNYDGLTNALDFTALASNFNETLSLAPGAVALGGALVPEPASLAMLALLCGMVRRRRI